MSSNPEQSRPDIPVSTTDLELNNLYYYADTLIEALYEQEPDAAMHHYTFTGFGASNTILPEAIQSAVAAGSSLHDINFTIIQNHADDLCSVAVSFGLFNKLGTRTEPAFSFPPQPDSEIETGMTIKELSAFLFSMAYGKEAVETRSNLLLREDVRCIEIINNLIPHFKSYACAYDVSVDYQLPTANDEAVDIRVENTYEYPDTMVVGLNISCKLPSGPGVTGPRIAVAIDPRRNNPAEYTLYPAPDDIEGIKTVDNSHPLVAELVAAVRGAIANTFPEDDYVISADELRKMVNL